jgi:hypothetical protein
MTSVPLNKQTIAAFQRKLGKVVEQKIRAVADELLPKIVDRTPVDTGAARDGWIMNDAGAGWSYTIKITNAMPYAAELEHGSSQQAPHGMIAVSVWEVVKP